MLAFAILTFEVGVGEVASSLSPKKRFHDTNVTIEPRYTTKSFGTAPYFLFRGGKWWENDAIELEWLRHSFSLKTQLFESRSPKMQNGYDLLFLDYARDVKLGIARLGVGTVIPHRNTFLEPRVEINPGTDIKTQVPTFAETATKPRLHFGPAFQVSLGRRFKIDDLLFGFFEAKMTGAFTHVKMAKQASFVPTYAGYVLIGIGLTNQLRGATFE